MPVLVKMELCMDNALVMLHHNFNPYVLSDSKRHLCDKILSNPLKVALHLYGFCIAIYVKI